jgi:hypothetical protein
MHERRTGDQVRAVGERVSAVQQALEVLGSRGIVPDETLIRAMDVPIGLLGMTMAPRDDLSPPSGQGDRRPG